MNDFFALVGFITCLYLIFRGIASVFGVSNE